MSTIQVNQIKKSSVHDVEPSKLRWQEFDGYWQGIAEVGAYTVYLYAGEVRYSSPGSKLVSHKNYNSFEIHLFRGVEPVCVRSPQWKVNFIPKFNLNLGIFGDWCGGFNSSAIDQKFRNRAFPGKFYNKTA